MEDLGNKKEVQQETVYALRFNDSGDLVVVVSETGQKSYELNRVKGYWEEVRPEVSNIPKLTKKLPIGSLLNLGEGQTFLVVEPKKSANAGSFKESVYVKRIPLETKNEGGEVIEGFNQMVADYKSKGKSELIYDAQQGNAPPLSS